MTRNSFPQRILPSIALFVFSLLGCSVSAATLAPASVAAQVFFNRSPPDGLSISDFGSFPLSGPGGSLRFDSGGMPSAFARAEARAAPGFFGRSSGQLVFDMEILGEAGEVPVQVAVAGGATGSSSNQPFTGFALKALWRIDDVNLGLTPVFGEGIDTAALQGSFSDSFSHTVDLTLTAGHVYRITLMADAGAGAVDSASETIATAFIDPVFTFGAGVGAEYSFRFSDGIGNSPIPVPGSLALFAPALLALTSRSRRANACVAASAAHRW